MAVLWARVDRAGHQLQLLAEPPLACLSAQVELGVPSGGEQLTNAGLHTQRMETRCERITLLAGGRLGSLLVSMPF